MINNLAYYGLGAETYFGYELAADKPGDAGRLSSQLEGQMMAYIVRSAIANERTAEETARAATALERSTNPSEESLSDDSRSPAVATD